jgi:hypothetical protein
MEFAPTFTLEGCELTTPEAYELTTLEVCEPTTLEACEPSVLEVPYERNLIPTTNPSSP